MVKVWKQNVERRALLNYFYKLEGIKGGFRLEKVPKYLAKQIERLVSSIGSEVLLYPKNGKRHHSL